MSNTPSANGPNGRNAKGQFARGNPGGPGNPEAAKVQKLRSALLRAVTASDVRDVTKKLIDKAKGGDAACIKILFDRLLGPAQSADFLERLEALERKLRNH